MAAHLRRGQAYRQQDQNDEAARDWHDAARLAQKSTQPLELLGDLYSAEGADAQAAAYYEKAAQLDPADPGKLYKLSLARYRAGQPSIAIEPLQQAVALNDNFAEAHYLLGLVLRDVHRTAEAAASLERAVRISPSLLAAHEELADLYAALGRPVDELAQLQTLSSLDASPRRDAAIAVAESRRGEFDGAIATLSSAADRDPADPQLQLALGRAYLEKSERTMDRRSVSAALGALERALGGGVRRADGLTLLGRALYLSGDDAGAERMLQEAVSGAPLVADALAYLADACERQREYDPARDALQKLDALQGDTAPPAIRVARARRIGQLSLLAGDSATAIEFFKRALDAGPRDPALLGALAEAEFKSGDTAAAKSTLTEALALAPQNADLLRLKRVLR